jgi:Zn-dependent M16 (insulinase) family peptidase
LELCLRTLPAWNYGGDILPMLDQAPAIARLKQRFANPAALSTAIRTRLLAHPHRGTFTAIPDAGFLDRQDERIDADAQAEAARSNPADLQRAAEALAARQAHRDDPAVLPDLELSDVPPRRRWTEPVDTRDGVVVFTPGTNGILHHVLALPLPDLADDDVDLLPVLTQAMGQLGVGNQGYAERAAWLSARCAGVSAWTDISVDHTTPGAMRAWWCAEVRGLADRHADFIGLLDDTLEHLRLDEHDRLKELLEQSAQRLQERVQGAGSSFAARAAGRGFGAAASLSHRLGGLGRLAWLKSTVTGLNAPDGRERLIVLAQRLEALRKRLMDAPRHHALIGDVADRLAFTRIKPQSITTQLASPVPKTVAPTAWLTATAVNYCALAFPAVPMSHPDAAPLAVAGRLLTHQVLHPRIREQGGAYGASASYASGSASFSLTSYRDPRLTATYDDLRDSLRWLQTCPDDPRPIKEAVLGVIADLDTPGSPAGEARARFNGALKGIATTDLDAHRQRILAVTPKAIRNAAERWLDPTGGTSAVITGPAAWDEAKLGWASERI